MQLYRVSVLISSTRQAMSALIYADSPDEAMDIYEELTAIKRSIVGTKDMVVDEIPMEKGVICTLHNDREVLLKYFPPRGHGEMGSR